MADPQIAATVSPVPTGPVQPATTQADDGFERVSRDELTTLRRNSEKVRGMEGFYQEASRRGFKRPEDFGKYDKFSETLGKRKMTMEQVQALLEGEPDQAPEQSGGLDPAALDKYLADKGYVNKSTLDEREARTLATVSHREAMAKEQVAMEKRILDLTGEKATPFQKKQIAAVLKQEADAKRKFYPVGHPLGPKQGDRGLDYTGAEIEALDEKALDELVAAIKKEQGLADGADLAAQADASLAGKQWVATPAGSSSSGTQPPAKPSDKTMRPGGKPPVADVEAAYKRIQARRGGGTVSSLGG
jgi:hypothetical protein